MAKTVNTYLKCSTLSPIFLLSMNMIEGVEIKSVIKHPTPVGFFAELVKQGEPSFHDIRQTSYAETNPGVTKPFHFHKGYWEIWCVIKGAAR